CAQTVAFTATNDNPALFSDQPAVSPDGTLTYTAAANAFGTAIVSVLAQDTGGTSNGGVDMSATQSLTIEVKPVNDAPSFDKGADQSAPEDGGPIVVPNWATHFSAGPNETNQHLRAYNIVGNTNAALFATG